MEDTIAESSPRRGGPSADRPSVHWWSAHGPERHPPGAPVFVLVHGLGLSHRSFSRLAAALVAHGPVLAPDLPGFGRSPGPGRRLTIPQLAEALLPRLDELASAPLAGPVVLVGHSLGAQVVVEMALRRPDVVAGVVLVGPVVDRVAPSVVGQGRRLALDMLGEPPLTSAMVTRDYLRGGLLSYAAGTRSMLRHPIDERLPGLAAPLLVLRGRHDPVAPARWADELVALVADGEARDVPAAVHDVVHSRAAAVGREVVDFARRCCPGAVSQV
ncbi:alpha/beta fold hydrolase [Frigoribacterium endophyticum]|uniref:alpha/beta fold hydrolase n=1 Tax=Frigoribacterium endophyticum TaxID=1522176 RepID=UPI00141FB6A3|nr:pimeloyl-ACP methyl ester carboxylesterase [Frigoribacterium endophyticum]